MEGRRYCGVALENQPGAKALGTSKNVVKAVFSAVTETADGGDVRERLGVELI